jgi:hypothetical protein
MNNEVYKIDAFKIKYYVEVLKTLRFTRKLQAQITNVVIGSTGIKNQI